MRFQDGGFVQATRRSAGGYAGISAGSSDRGEMVVRGTLKTPWGPAEIEGIASRVARQEYDADRPFERSRAGG